MRRQLSPRFTFSSQGILGCLVINFTLMLLGTGMPAMGDVLSAKDAELIRLYLADRAGIAAE